MISLIAAIGKNRELGKDNKLIWKLPADMLRFKEITSGHTVIMGRKTFESIGKPLTNRTNIVLSRDIEPSGEKIWDKLDDRIITVSSIENILPKLKDEEEYFIIGGASIYKQFLPYAKKLYITHIDDECKDADSFFPEIGPEWKKILYEKSKDNSLKCEFVIYRKQGNF